MVTTAWLTSVGVLIAISAFMKYYSKEKMIKQVEPICKVIGKSISTFILLKFRKTVAEKIENGLFCTVLDVVAHMCNRIKFYMTEDNKKD
jgi:hypothetical protein